MKDAGRRELWTLLGAALALRALLLWALPPLAVSADLRHWLDVGLVLKGQGNPYVLTPYLNWPPLWLGVLYALLRLALGLGLSFIGSIRAFLLLVELAGLAAAHAGLSRLKPGAAFRPLLWALALNPVPALLTCQHGNFDALVGLWALLFCLALVRHQETSRAVDWLAACALLGLGVLTKTAPLILSPLLLPGFLRAGRGSRLLGLWLLLGPAALGVGVLYVLAPGPVTRHVLSYRSQAGFFGLTGLLGPWYGALAPWLLAGAAAEAGRLALRPGGLGARGAFQAAALLLLCVPVLGPGYAPQYAAWSLPLLAGSWVLDEDGAWRRALLLLLAVSVPTYLAEYALLPSHGMSLVWLTGREDLRALGEALGEPGSQTLLRLPLFAAGSWALWRGWRRLAPSERAAAGREGGH